LTRKTLGFLILLQLLFCLCCCKTSALFPTRSDVRFAQKRWPGSNRQSLQEGFDLYQAHCGHCHEFYAPKAYSEDEWTDIMHKMARKSHLQEGQEEEVRRYIFTCMASATQTPSAHK